MKKEKKVRTYQRRTKTGKLVTVKQHTAKYDAAEKAKEMLKKKGAGDELSAKKKTKPVSSAGELDFSQADFKAWYHWDQENDPKNPTALKVEKALKAKMGAKAYRKYFNDMSDSYSARGHLKAYKECQSCGDKGDVKSKSVEAKVKTPKDATPKEERTPSKITAHAHGNTKTRWDVTPTSAMLKDVKLTKMLDGDAYEETFPKGGSYEFFIGEHKKAGKTRTGVYVKSGKDVTYLDDGEEILPASFLKKLKASKPGVTKEKSVGLTVDTKLARRVMKEEDFDSLREAKSYLADMPKSSYDRYVKLYAERDAKEKSRTGTVEGIKKYTSSKAGKTGFTRLMGSQASSAKKTLLENGYTEVRGVPEYRPDGTKRGTFTGLIGPNGEAYLYRGGGMSPALLVKADKSKKKDILERHKTKTSPKSSEKTNKRDKQIEAANKAKAALDKYIKESGHSGILRNSRGDAAIGKLVKKGVSLSEATKIVKKADSLGAAVERRRSAYLTKTR